MTETAPQYRIPSPLLGQHNEEVYAQFLGYEKDYLEELRDALA